MPIAYSYIRFSKAEQKKGDSLRRQIELSEKYAASNGLTLDDTLDLRDIGLSAFDRSNIERGALGAFLDAVKTGRVTRGSYLLVESLDRLSRDRVLAALNVFTSILEQGITIVTLADNMVYSIESVAENTANLMFSIMIMARAHDESLNKSRRLSAAWIAKRANANKKKLTSQCPRWMRFNPDSEEFELIPERVEVIREIIAWHKTGLGRTQIVKRLNDRKEPVWKSLPARKAQAHAENGVVEADEQELKGWHSSYVHRIISNPAIYGELEMQAMKDGILQPVGEPIQDYYPAVISKEEYYLLQNITSERSQYTGCSFACCIDPVSLTRPPYPCECRNPVVRPLKAQSL